MLISWHPDAWNDYLDWQTGDKKTLKKINELIKDIMATVIPALASQNL